MEEGIQEVWAAICISEHIVVNEEPKCIYLFNLDFPSTREILPL